jgi:hypothetical protein
MKPMVQRMTKRLVFEILINSIGEGCESHGSIELLDAAEFIGTVSRQNHI